VDFGENGVDFGNFVVDFGNFLVSFGGYLDRYVDRGSEKSKAGLGSIHEWFCSFFPFAIIFWWAGVDLRGSGSGVYFWGVSVRFRLVTCPMSCMARVIAHHQGADGNGKLRPPRYETFRWIFGGFSG
jgi:hypothetical protein